MCMNAYITKTCKKEKKTQNTRKKVKNRREYKKENNR